MCKIEEKHHHPRDPEPQPRDPDPDLTMNIGTGLLFGDVLAVTHVAFEMYDFYRTKERIEREARETFFALKRIRDVRDQLKLEGEALRAGRFLLDGAATASEDMWAILSKGRQSLVDDSTRQLQWTPSPAARRPARSGMLDRDRRDAATEMRRLSVVKRTCDNCPGQFPTRDSLARHHRSLARRALCQRRATRFKRAPRNDRDAWAHWPHASNESWLDKSWDPQFELHRPKYGSFFSPYPFDFYGIGLHRLFGVAKIIVLVASILVPLVSTWSGQTPMALKTAASFFYCYHTMCCTLNLYNTIALGVDGLEVFHSSPPRNKVLLRMTRELQTWAVRSNAAFCVLAKVKTTYTLPPLWLVTWYYYGVSAYITVCLHAFIATVKRRARETQLASTLSRMAFTSRAKRGNPRMRTRLASRSIVATISQSLMGCSLSIGGMSH